MRVAHVSDLHITSGPRLDDQRACLDAILADAARAEPDLWLVTGDLWGTTVPLPPLEIPMFVFVRIGGTDEKPETRPVLVVKSWGPDCVNAQLFLDGLNDDRYSQHYAFSLPEGIEGAASCYLFAPRQPEACKPSVPARTSDVVWVTSITRGPGIGQWTHEVPAIK